MGHRAWILVWCALASTATARGDARPTEDGRTPAERPQIDATKLPPAATNRIDFARDVQPIFERSCLRCHGPERPKSKFRLDTRVTALQGGEDNREDIIPGDSAHSPLIHYVARLVKEMEMPPPGKGEPITPAQIGILRAWIDQGAEWSGAVVETAQSTAALFAGGYFVSGNRSVFRELLWRPVGGNGGLEEFTLRQNLDAWSRFFMEGHSWRDDTSLKVQVERSTLGFVRLGVDQYRKYYSDSGGYYPFFSPPVYSLGRDLHMDIGKAYVDFGLTLPNWPKLTVGYEFQQSDGEKSTLQWGAVDQGLAQGPRNIFPASKEIHERTHIIKFGVDHEIWGVHIEDNFRAEFYDLNTRRDNVDLSINATNHYSDGFKHFVGANTLRLEKQFTDWFLASAGYLYSHLDAHSSFVSETPVAQGFADRIVFDRESHVASFTTLLGPWDALSLFGGVQNEWSRQRGFGTYVENGLVMQPRSNLDKVLIEEHAGLRYTKIPFTVLFADARFRQENIGQYEEDLPDTLPTFFRRDTDATAHSKDVRVGFTTSPWSRISFSANYRWADNKTRYNHILDEGPFPLDGAGYSAFIRGRDIRTDEIELKLVLRPASWIKTTLQYKLSSIDYVTDTDPVQLPLFGFPDITPGGALPAGSYDTHTYSANLVITPVPRLYIASTFSCMTAKTTTEANGVPSVVPYKGDTYNVLGSATYALSEKTDVQVGYLFSYADFGQDNFADGLPLGIVYHQHGVQAAISRRFQKYFSARLQYGFNIYTEASSGGFNDFTAHSLFATLSMRWP